MALKNFLLTLTLLGSAFTLPAYADFDIDRKVETTNVQLGDERGPNCSATIIDAKEKIVLTAAHCVQQTVRDEMVETVNPETGEITTKKIRKLGRLQMWRPKWQDYHVVSSEMYTVKTLATNQVMDLAIVKIEDSDLFLNGESELPPEGMQLQRGQDIYVIGNPLGELDGSVSKGIISAPQRAISWEGRDPTPYFQIDAAVVGGNSGGAVYNKDGQLIGVVSAGLTKSTIAFVVPADEIRKFLKANKVKKYE